eukprot:TRINITY_DN46874_c0_g1_i1.p1 TRINITY_DN46874_c0_g1~~TRINITY_DN46874_c0_g1_i1.p1  ORF type:complete len:347 (+),score=3.72 TRINITY_DN46874_c0_g1_i1:3-1043(+)
MHLALFFVSFSFYHVVRAIDVSSRPASYSAKEYQYGVCGPKSFVPVYYRSSPWGRTQENQWYRLVLVHHPSRLAVCRISKNANSQLSLLFNSLNGLNASMHSSAPCCPHSVKRAICRDDASIGRYNVSYDALLRKEWTIKALIRDPLERLLSGFNTICGFPNRMCTVAKAKYQSVCCPDGGRLLPELSDTSALLEYGIQAFERLVTHGLQAQEVATDTHIITQTHAIERNCRVPLWRLDAVEVLHNADRHQTNLAVRKLVQPAFGTSHKAAERHVGKFFPKRGHADRRAKEHSVESHKMVRLFYRSPRIVQLALEYVRTDYEKLQLPHPSWLSAALDSTVAEHTPR